MTAQTRLIIAGLAVSTAFILCTAGFAIYSIDKNMNSAYRSFAQVLAKTLAIEGVELTKEVPQLAKYDALRTNSMSILKSNDDIAFITFKDNKSKVIKSVPKNKEVESATEDEIFGNMIVNKIKIRKS